MKDLFFEKKNCDRCHAELTGRTMSWFTTETICLECSNKETVIKRKLREMGRDDKEGCGYVPIIA